MTDLQTLTPARVDRMRREVHPGDLATLDRLIAAAGGPVKLELDFSRAFELVSGFIHAEHLRLLDWPANGDVPVGDQLRVCVNTFRALQHYLALGNKGEATQALAEVHALLMDLSQRLGLTDVGKAIVQEHARLTAQPTPLTEYPER